MKAVVFGINGQDGYYLNKLLKENHVEVIGVSRANKNFELGDVSDFKFVNRLIAEYKPNYIFHLAANSTTRHDALFENHQTIATGSLNILEAVYKNKLDSKVFLSGSGLQFQNKGLPIKETDPFEARDAYSISRIQSVYAAHYFRKLGVKAYVGYFFHHDSELRSERHLNMKIAQAAKRIKAGSKEKLEIGDTSVVKEFNFAGDFMKATWLLVNQDDFFEAVIGSGIGYTIEDWLSICFQKVGLNWQDIVVSHNQFKPEFRKLVSDPNKLHSIGWLPEVGFSDLAIRMLNA